MNIGNSIHRAVERFAVTRVTQSPAGLAPISRITRIRPAKREGETSEKEPRTRFCVPLTTELRNACVALSDRVSPAIFFPRSFSLSSFQNFLFDVSLFLDWKNRRSNVDRRGLDFSDLFESKIESLRLGQDSREESLKLKNKIFLRILENFVSRNKKLSHSSIGWKFESMYLRKIVLEFLNFCRERASRERDPSWSDSNRFYPIRLDRSRIDPI